jgi:hypothetical protein
MKKTNLTKSSSLPSIFVNSEFETKKLSNISNDLTLKRNDINIKSLHEFEAQHMIKIHSQLSVENNEQITNSRNKSELDMLVSPKLISQKINHQLTDPMRVITITEIIEINNNSSKSPSKGKEIIINFIMILVNKILEIKSSLF